MGRELPAPQGTFFCGWTKNIYPTNFVPHFRDEPSKIKRVGIWVNYVWTPICVFLRSCRGGDNLSPLAWGARGTPLITNLVKSCRKVIKRSPWGDRLFMAFVKVSTLRNSSKYKRAVKRNLKEPILRKIINKVDLVARGDPPLQVGR